MILKHPCEITPRLMAGVRINDAFISIEYSGRPGDEGRTRYRYYIDTPATEEWGDDLQSGAGGGDLRTGLESLLGFLGAFAEAREGGENADLFPDTLREWAQQNSDEISMAALEVEETPDCVVE
jgi:hypothetical protein